MSDALVAAFPARDPVRSCSSGPETVRDVVVPGLTAKGWRVDEVVAYRTVAGRRRPRRHRRPPGRRTRSPSPRRRRSSGTVDLLGRDGVPPVVASIGPVTTGAVRAAGLSVDVEAVEHTLDGLVAALVAGLGGAPPAAVPGEGPTCRRRSVG